MKKLAPPVTFQLITFLIVSSGSPRLVYEGHEDFSVLPTFGVLPALRACFEQVQEGLPGIAIDLSMVRTA